MPQYTDPTVSRKKFDAEIAQFKAMGHLYRERGWFLVHAEYPNALVVLVATKVRPPVVVMGVAFDYSNYDAAPPSVRMVNPFTGEPYKSKELPSQLNRSLPQQAVELPGMPPGASMIVGQIQALMQSYGPEEIPFLCLSGVREYHEHPGHSGDVWELHRPTGAGRLVRLLEVIHKYGVEPITGLGVQMIPKIHLNFGQPPQ